MAPPSLQTATSTRRPTAMSTKTPEAGGRKPREPRATRTTPPRTTPSQPTKTTHLSRPALLSPRGGEARRNLAHRPGEVAEEAEAEGGNPGQRALAVHTAAAEAAAGDPAKQPRTEFVTQSRRSKFRRPNFLEE